MADLVEVGLLVILMALLAGPFLWKRIERNLEAFLLIFGILAAAVGGVLVTSGGQLNLELVRKALWEPLAMGIVPAVLVAGLVFHYAKDRVRRGMTDIAKKVPLKLVVFAMVVVLGLVSSLITAIIAALLLVELVDVLPLDRKRKVETVIISSFSIGLGAVLTPMGEPLSTIATAALSGNPYHAGFFFFIRHLGIYILPGVVSFGIIAAMLVGGQRPVHLEKLLLIRPGDARYEDDRRGDDRYEDGRTVYDRYEDGRTGDYDKSVGKPGPGRTGGSGPERLRDVFVRVVKVYVFVIALIFLGAGLSVLIDRFIAGVPGPGLYWMNMVSAVLDNATLTAAEINASLSIVQIRMAVMGLLVAGGMLLPGNIPNIISANKLNITSREWARLGVPLGLAAMVVYFVWMTVIPFP